MTRLNKRVAIITGAANGIGKAIALRFVSEGAHVALWDVQEEKGLAVVNEIQSAGGKANFYNVNTADAYNVKQAFTSVLTDFGKVDILINNAGILRDASLLKMTEQQFDEVLNVNLKGFFNCTKAVAPHMIENGYGRIVQATSIVAQYGNFGQTNYVASKAGIIGMTKVWARELGRKGITVNAVAPGYISTDMVESLPPDVLTGLKEKVPINRMGTAAEVASVYLFLASEEASFVNGTVVNVDGGALV